MRLQKSPPAWPEVTHSHHPLNGEPSIHFLSPLPPSSKHLKLKPLSDHTPNPMATSFLLQSNLKLNPFSHHHPFFNKFPFSNPPKLITKPTKSPPKRSLTSKTHNTESTNKAISQNPFEILIKTLVKTLKKPAVVAVLLGLLLFYDPNSALAASGGRTGGRSFSSSSSRSYSSGSSSRSFSGSASYYAPSPFGFGGGGFYMGPAFGVGVGAGSSLFFIFMGFAAFLLVSGFLSDKSEGGVLTATEKTSVLKVQVGLLGLARSLQRDLNRIAETADTSKKEGLTYILTEATLAMLRHPDYCISGYSSVDIKSNMEDGEKRFNRLSIEERGKFDEETLVNVNNIKKQSTSSKKSTGFNNEYIVITILVAAEGVHKLPAINSSEDLKEALKKLGSIPTSKTLAVEVLWTPQNENDTLTERELLEDYPLLRAL